MFVLLCWARAANPDDLVRRYAQDFAAPSERVVLKVSRGVIEVVNGPANGRVRFEVTMRIQKGLEGTDAKALLDRIDLMAPFRRAMETAFENMAPKYRAEKETVELVVRDSREVMVDTDPGLQMVIEVKAIVPEGLDLVVTGVAAGVNLGDYVGNVSLKTDSGSYFIKSVSGNLEARADGGSITVGAVGGRSDLHTVAGSILTGRLHGPADLSTSNGTVEVQQALDTLRVRGDDADIVLGLSAPLPKSVDMATSAGRITVNMDKTLPVTVDASTRLLGTVKARGLALTVREGAVNRSALLADVNGGGIEPLRLRTQWGNIVLVGREPLDG
jgi:hypothetical protein